MQHKVPHLRGFFMLGCVQGRCLVDVAQREPEYLHEASSHKLFICFLIYLFVQWCDMRAEAQRCRLGLNRFCYSIKTTPGGSGAYRRNNLHARAGSVVLSLLFRIKIVQTRSFAPAINQQPDWIGTFSWIAPISLLSTTGKVRRARTGPVSTFRRWLDVSSTDGVNHTSVH